MHQNSLYRVTFQGFCIGLYDNNREVRVYMEFLLKCITRYLISEVSERVGYRAREYKL